MIRFYTNENIPAQVVAELRRLGHDVMTSLDAGRANSAVPDDEVLAFAGAAPDSLNPQSPPFSPPASTPNYGSCGYRRLHVRPGFLQTGATN
jgi:hypothetical protein